jgi:hypothetical protein
MSGGSLDETRDPFAMVRQGEVDLLVLPDDQDASSGGLATRLAGAPDLDGRIMELPPIEGFPRHGFLIGRHASLNRFIRIGAPVTDPGPADDVVSGTYPVLPDPTEIAPFPEASTQDPFGQNPRLLQQAWSLAAQHVGTLLRRAHHQGFSISLPDPPAGVTFLAIQPWRDIVPVSESDDRAWEAAAPVATEDPPTVEDGLNLVQRCLLALNALAPEDDDPLWHSASALLESLGYATWASHLDVEQLDDLKFYVAIGHFAANLHARQSLHGDLHPGNFGFLDNGVVAIDADTISTLARPVTISERAADLANLKLNCRFEQWEAVKIGYSRVAPEPAAVIFQRL